MDQQPLFGQICSDKLCKPPHPGCCAPGKRPIMSQSSRVLPMRKQGSELQSTSKLGKCITRRSLVLGAGAGALGLSASAVNAQTTEARWWESIFDSTAGARRRGPSEPRPEALNDLRPDATPWRSDVMLSQMDAVIARYQKIVSQGGWLPVPGGRLLRPGDDDERVPYVRRRLIISGDLGSGGSSYDLSYGFDGRLEDAVKRFQESFGLRTTGRVDQPTIAQLNVPAHARLEQLRLNQRRIRELLQGRVEDRYILVNVAAFQLEAVEGHQVRLRHRVIVGKPDRQTPSIKASVRGLNFFPYWRVPDSVATLDLIPRLVKEPDYLMKEQIRAFNGYGGPEIDTTAIDWRQVDPAKVKFRQDPGPQNALGLVRIDMPNEHIVYMHDTPMKPLFNQRGRAFSAGCVRVQDVFELVEWIARYEAGWEQPGRVRDVIAAGQPLDVTLTRPVPVYFTYITAWAEADGRAEFRPDIYGRDGSRELVGERDPEAAPPPYTLAP
ncbi:MAG: L,D-transpeptidase family protein [Hyphomicrobiaceae bacterium]|nr:L,D-transpeptidase family protein [Hyphomicrobiaceae bacterium]